jgi:hypothetical protein
MSFKLVGPGIVLFLVGILVGYILNSWSLTKREGFTNAVGSDRNCNTCRRPVQSCGCEAKHPENSGRCDKCPQIDWSKYVLKASIPPCPQLPDMSRYMLKSECPAPPDMSRYILKSAVPPCPPCISTCNKPCKIGECPPCPRPRCPVVQCPEPKSCPPCAPVEPPRCPEPKVSCKADYEPRPEEPWMVRPLLASISPM